MRVLLSTIGSRGDVQPVVALAVQLRALGQEVRICAPPDFREWIEALGIPVRARRTRGALDRGSARPRRAGPAHARAAASDNGRTRSPPSSRRSRRQPGAVTFSWRAMALQFAASLGGRADGSPLRLRRLVPDHPALAAPCAAPIAVRGQTPADGTADNRTLWIQDAKRWNDHWGAAINSHRASAGLAPVSDVRSHIFTDRPWLAADPTLAPWPETADLDVVQTGAWILPDQRPLSPELEAFLDAGEPPVYFGFGSMRAPQDLSQAMIQAARALGRRAIVSRGWAGLALPDNEPDCLSIGEVNLQALFRRVAAVVHHGGAGTTTAAAQAGAPQVVVPQMLRPALLGTADPRPRDRNRARARRAHRRLADRGAQRTPSSRTWRPVPEPSPPRCAPTARRSPRGD